MQFSKIKASLVFWIMAFVMVDAAKLHNKTMENAVAQAKNNKHTYNSTLRNFNMRHKLLILATFCANRDCQEYGCTIRPAIRSMRKCLLEIGHEGTKKINDKFDLRRRVRKAFKQKDRDQGEPAIALAMSALNATSNLFDGYINYDAISRDYWEVIMGSLISLFVSIKAILVYRYACCKRKLKKKLGKEPVNIGMNRFKPEHHTALIEQDGPTPFIARMKKSKRPLY